MKIKSRLKTHSQMYTLTDSHLHIFAWNELNCNKISRKFYSIRWIFIRRSMQSKIALNERKQNKIKTWRSLALSVHSSQYSFRACETIYVCVWSFEYLKTVFKAIATWRIIMLTNKKILLNELKCHYNCLWNETFITIWQSSDANGIRMKS